MTTTANPTTTERPPAARPALAVKLLAGLALARLALHLLTNRGYGYFIDELYYLACADHLDWGYVDQPPGVAAVAWVARHLFGDSLAGLRLLPALAGAAIVFLAGVIARELGGGRFAQGLAALATWTSPLLLFTATILSMNVFDVLFCTLALLVLVRILGEGEEGRRRHGLRPWALLGVILGLGLLTKISPLFLGAGLTVGLLATPERRWFATAGPWLAGALAGLLFLPHIVWQVRHGWPTLEFMHNAATYKNRPVSPWQLFFGQALEAQPVAFVLLVAGLAWFLLAPRERPWRVFAWMYLTVFAIFAVGHAKPYYFGVLFPLLFAAGAVALDEAAAAWKAGWLRPVMVVAVLAMGAVALPLAVPLLPVDSLIAYQKAVLGGPAASQERTRVGLLPQHFADMFGHEELVAEVAKVFHSLPAAEQARTGIYADSYGEAGSVDLFGPRYGLPKAISGHNSYWLWGPGTRPFETLLVLGGSQEDHYDACTDVTLGGRFHHPYVMPRSNDNPIWICRGLKGNAEQIWPLVRHFI